MACMLHSCLQTCGRHDQWIPARFPSKLRHGLRSLCNFSATSNKAARHEGEHLLLKRAYAGRVGWDPPEKGLKLCVQELELNPKGIGTGSISSSVSTFDVL